MAWTELKTYRLRCDICRKHGPTVHVYICPEKEDIPEGWEPRTLSNCGMTGYSRNEIICPDCVARQSNWKCPMCDEDGFNRDTLGVHIKEKHPISDAEHEALDDVEVAGPLEGDPKSGKEIEELVRAAYEQMKSDDNPGLEMYSPSFTCEEEGHRGIRLKDGIPHCLDCDKPWTHIGEITS